MFFLDRTLEGFYLFIYLFILRVQNNLQKHFVVVVVMHVQGLHALIL